MKKFLFIFGTRPEAIKMAPVIKMAGEFGFEARICLSGQHKDMVVPFMKFFNLKADYDLDVMKANQDLSSLTAEILKKAFDVIAQEKPDMVLVQGDTTTTFAGALAAFYQKIPVAHIEAGLRTNDIYSPFPEEANRQMVSSIASLHFPPTETTKQNLAKEGRLQNVFVTGNTSIDALRLTRDLINTAELEKKYSQIDFSKKLILVTTHRRESHGAPLRSICKGIKALQREFDAQVIIPVHLNPNVKNVVESELGNIQGIHLMGALEYSDFVFFMEKSFLIMTDSGGVQEEGPYFGKPILVLRDNTERPEGLEAGTSVLVGTDSENIIKVASELFLNAEKYNQFKKNVNPYGDGQASRKILEVVKRFLE